MQHFDRNDLKIKNPGGKRNYVCLDKQKEKILRLKCTLLYDGEVKPLIEEQAHFEGDGSGTERI